MYFIHNFIINNNVQFKGLFIYFINMCVCDTYTYIYYIYNLYVLHFIIIYMYYNCINI